LRAIASALGDTKAPWMVIGGIAVIARGVRRLTTDIDAAVRGDAIEVSTLVRALAKKGIVPRISNAEAFAGENLVLLLRHEPSGVDFDVSFAWTEFEHRAIAAATDATFAAVHAPMARPEDLIVFKSIAGRGKDIDDVITLLTLYPKLDRDLLRARVRELAALADTPELADSLETAIAAVNPATSRSKPLLVAKPKTPRSTPSPRKSKPKKRRRLPARRA
jgi:hypothetical protein